MDHLGIQVVVGLVGGVICAAIAASKGRNVVGWFFFGFFIPLIGIIVALVVSNRKEEAEYRASAQAERRRLKERLRQEQLKSEAFRRHAAHRLDAHDQVLRIDTRQTPGLEAGAVAPVLSEGAPPPLPPVASERAWHYALEGEPFGPVPESALRTMLAEAELDAGTLVWTEGQSGWLPARAVSAFQDVVRS